jgi:hypothetical protein
MLLVLIHPPTSSASAIDCSVRSFGMLSCELGWTHKHGLVMLRGRGGIVMKPHPVVPACICSGLASLLEMILNTARQTAMLVYRCP